MERGASEPTAGPLDWDRCLDRLYDAVGREQQLAAALGDFRPFFDARGVAFVSIADMRHPTISHTGSVGISERGMVEYHTHFHAHDEWVLAAHRRADFVQGATYRGGDLVDRPHLKRSYFWKTFLTRHGVTDILTALVEASGQLGPASFITFHRHQGQRPYTRSDVRLLERLVPHLRQALRLHRRLAPSLAIGTTLRELVQGLDLAMLFLTADAAVADQNRAAVTHLETSHGWLRMQHGRLQAALLEGWVDLKPWLEKLPACGSLMLDLVRADRRCAQLDLRSVQGATTDLLAVYPVQAVATLTPGARDPKWALRHVHGLTPAEARVAVQVAQGLSAADISAAQQTSLATVRTQIASVLGKLALSRQLQLTAFVAAL